MNAEGQFVARLLDSARGAYAAGAAARLPGVDAPDKVPDTVAFTDLHSQASMMLRYLAESVAADRPRLLHDYLGWLKVAFAARSVSTQSISQLLEALGAELRDRLPPKAAAIATAQVDSARAFFAAAPEQQPSLIADGSPHVDLTRRFLLAILEARTDDATEILLTALADGVSFGVLCRDVITRAQAEVGRLWQTGQVHIGEEHLGSQIVGRVLTRLMSAVERAAPNGRRVLMACVGDDLHDIGLRMIADQFEVAGWITVFSGANTPADVFSRLIEEHQVDLVAISAHLALHVRGVAAVIATVRQASVAYVPILVGGGPFSAVDDLWRVTGADAVARDGDEALLRADELVQARA